MISIIIPVYNAEKYLRATLDSCLAQSYTNFEVLIINDGSKDNSLGIIEEYKAKDSRIRYINQTNKGLSATRDSGIKNICGEFILFLDSDDTIVPNALELLYTNQIENRTDIVIGSINSVFESGKILCKNINTFFSTSSKNRYMISLLQKSIMPSLCGRLFKKELFNGVKFNSDYTIGEDVITNLQIIQLHNPTVSLLSEHIYNYIQYPSSMVNSGGIATAKKREVYIEWVMDYIKPYLDDRELKDTFDKFITEEYFSFLRDAGVNSNNLKVLEYISNVAIKNKDAIKSLPIWRRLLVELFIYAPIGGKLLQKLINFARKLRG